MIKIIHQTLKTTLTTLNNKPIFALANDNKWK